MPHQNLGKGLLEYALANPKGNVVLDVARKYFFQAGKWDGRPVIVSIPAAKDGVTVFTSVSVWKGDEARKDVPEATHTCRVTRKLNGNAVLSDLQEVQYEDEAQPDQTHSLSDAIEEERSERRALTTAASVSIYGDNTTNPHPETFGCSIIVPTKPRSASCVGPPRYRRKILKSAKTDDSCASETKKADNSTEVQTLGSSSKSTKPSTDSLPSGMSSIPRRYVKYRSRVTTT